MKNFKIGLFICLLGTMGYRILSIPDTSKQNDPLFINYTVNNQKNKEMTTGVFIPRHNAHSLNAKYKSRSKKEKFTAVENDDNPFPQISSVPVSPKKRNDFVPRHNARPADFHYGNRSKKGDFTGAGNAGNPLPFYAGRSSRRSAVNAGNGMPAMAISFNQKTTGSVMPPFHAPSGTNGEEDPFDDGSGNNPGGTYNDSPVGNELYALLLLAALYALGRAVRNRETPPEISI